MPNLLDRFLSASVSGKRSWSTYALLTPGVFWLTLFLALPLLLMFATSFTQRGPYGLLIWKFTLANYSRALSSAYWPVVIRSIIYALTATGLCLALGYPLAYYLSFYAGRRKGLLLTLIMIPFWTSCLVSIYSWMILLGREGLVNNTLLYFGLIATPIQFLNTPFSVILGLVYFYLPFMIMPLYSCIEKIPRSLIDASHDLGAGPAQTFWRVSWPLSRPGILAGSILTFIPCLGDFLTAEFLGGSKTYILGNLIQNQFLSAQDWPFGSAVAVILMLVMMAGLSLQGRQEPIEASGRTL